MKKMHQIIEILKQIKLSKKDISQWDIITLKFVESFSKIYSFYGLYCVFNKKESINVYGFIKQRLNEHEQKELITKLFDIKGNYDLKSSQKPINTFFYQIPSYKENFYNNSFNLDSIEFLFNDVSDGFISISFISQTLKDKETFQVILEFMNIVVNSARELTKIILDYERKAGCDPLTGVYNKTVFTDLLKKEVLLMQRNENTEAFSIAILDLDDFKQINDMQGHLVGDLYLKKFADIIKRVIRRSDILARIGGDEFALLLKKCEAYNAANVIAKVKYILKEQRISIKFSTGIAQYPIHGTDYQTLLKKADQALYISKRSGKNKIIISDCVNKSNIDDIQNFVKLKRVKQLVKQDKIVPFFQPIIDFSKEKPTIFGYEVLMRLINEKGEVVPAKKFIDVVENTDNIFHLGKKIIEKTFKYELDKNILLFINLSPFELKNVYYINWLIDYIKKAAYPTNRICFEITERESLTDLNIAKKSIMRLIKNKFKIAIDDFGSGYAGLIYLKKFPVNFLKVDKEFVKNLKNNKNSLLFFQAIKNLCDNLQVKLIAEGIENQEILNILKENGIYLMQGYYLGKPKSVEQLNHSSIN